jgi:hypothetical protein
LGLKSKYISPPAPTSPTEYNGGIHVRDH